MLYQNKKGNNYSNPYDEEPKLIDGQQEKQKGGMLDAFIKKYDDLSGKVADGYT